MTASDIIAIRRSAIPAIGRFCPVTGCSGAVLEEALSGPLSKASVVIGAGRDQGMLHSSDDRRNLIGNAIIHCVTTISPFICRRPLLMQKGVVVACPSAVDYMM